MVRELGRRTRAAKLRAADAAGPGHGRRSARRGRFRGSRQCSCSLRASRRWRRVPDCGGASPDRHIQDEKGHAMKRSDPRRGASLVTVLGSIALLSALRVMRHALLPAAIFVFLLSSAAVPGAVAIAQVQDRACRCASKSGGGAIPGAAINDRRSPAVFTESPSTRAAARTRADRAGCRAAGTATSTAQPGSFRCGDGWRERSRRRSFGRGQENGARTDRRRDRWMEGQPNRRTQGGVVA